MRNEIINLYNDLFEKYKLEKKIDSKKINQIVKKALLDFLHDKKEPAIYCFGGHTKMLMADFIYELKEVKFIVDNNQGISGNQSGFSIISDSEIESKNIDAIIISSYKFKNQIAKHLRESHANIPFLDIYEVIEKEGINLKSDYYYCNHPFHFYKSINVLQNQNSDDNLLEIVTKYIQIKDFRNAVKWSEKLVKLRPTKYNKNLLRDLITLSELVLDGYSNIPSDNVLMLCLDGFRGKDFDEKLIPDIYREVQDNWIYYENAYSYSTSTFESLIPVYSGNTDQRTSYSTSSVVSDQQCEFIRKAKSQDRNIFFFTDMEHYVESDSISYTDSFQTLSEKMWDFLVNAVDEVNGLFYIHGLYETHYSFANPYTKDFMLSEGTAMLFDYLPYKGGKLRTDYITQHNDSLHYVNDILAPILKRLNNNVVLFADHGNLILDRDTEFESVKTTKFVADEEWIRIPLAIKTHKKQAAVMSENMSLLNLNKIICNLLDNDFRFENKDKIVKCGRTEIYNPDFKYLYKKRGCEQYLLAFEAFIFQEGYKLIVFSNGFVELYDCENDLLIEDEGLSDRLLAQIKNEITVF